MQFDILTLFPDLIHNYAAASILGRAQAQGLVAVRAHNWRAFSGNKWGHVDDKPYGGGPGMILRAEPIFECLKSIKALKHESIKTAPKSKVQSLKSKVIVMDPAGKKFDQRMAEKFSKLDRLVLIAGRYEGFDARVYKFVDERVSIGDYVLAGGELAALVIIEAVARLLPGVLGNPESLREESFGLSSLDSRLLSLKSKVQPARRSLGAGGSPKSVHEYPQYTRPENFMGWKVPKVLLSGDHKKIAEWRNKQSKSI